MLKSLCSFLLVIFLLPTQLIAQPIFSPYVDMTLTPQWDDKTQALGPLDLMKLSSASQVKDFHLAFVNDADHCKPAWGGNPSYTTQNKWAANLTQALRAEKIHYTISFGGSVGNDLSLFCTPEQLVGVYQQLVSDYHPNGLDFDIENGHARVDVLLNALKTVQKDHPTLKLSFTLPVMPEGLKPEGKQILMQAQAKGLNFHVNIMTMDFGQTYTGDMADYAIQAANNVFLFLRDLYPNALDAHLWRKIELTPMIGVNDIHPEQMTLANIATLHEFAKRQHLGGLSMWSIQRDHPCAEKNAVNFCSGNQLQSQDYEYTRYFMH